MPSRARIRERLLDPGDDFSVSPLPPSTSIGAGAVDLAVGGVFLPAERSSLPAVGMRDDELVASPADGNSSPHPLFAEVRVHPSGSFVMQPRQFVLAATFEYLTMPNDLAAIIQSRSTFGRMGIISATASYIAPGFKGCPTLEILNAGEVPIELRPYRRICQLILLPADEPEPRISRYQLSTRPWPARVHPTE